MTAEAAAQNETQKRRTAEKIDKGLDIARKLSAVTFLGLSAVNGAVGINAHNQVVEYEDFSHEQEQSGNLQGAELADDYVEQQEEARNHHLGVAGLQLATGLALLSLGSNKRTKEVIIPADKPTEQPKE